MLCLFLVLLNVIKDRHGKQRSAQAGPQKHFGTHQSCRVMNSAVGGVGRPG